MVGNVSYRLRFIWFTIAALPCSARIYMNYLCCFLIFMLSNFSYALSSEDNQEIISASEAAPDNVTEFATFLKFKDGDFLTIKKGVNNFTCFVVREPKGRYEPACLNQEAMRSVFPAYELHMKSLYSGLSYGDTYKGIKLAYERGEIPTAEAGSLVYMMSDKNEMYNPQSGELYPTPIHQMYFYPKLSNKTFSLKGGPPYLWQGFPHVSALIVVVSGE